MNENAVWLNAKAAHDLSIRDGDRVTLENSDGHTSLPILVRTTSGIRPDCAYVAHGFGQLAPGLHRANSKGASDNALISRIAIDPIMGSTGMRVNFIRVKPEVVS